MMTQEPRRPGEPSTNKPAPAPDPQPPAESPPKPAKPAKE